MLGQGLSAEEIGKRLFRLHNLERLHRNQKERIEKLAAENKRLWERVAVLEAENRELVAVVTDLKLQLEELRTIVFGKKKKQESGNDDDAPPVSRASEPRSKASYRRALPNEDEITDTKDHPVDRCIHCGGDFSDYDRAAYFEEDIPLPQRKIVVKHVIQKGYCEQCDAWSASAPTPPIPVVLGPNVRRYVCYLDIVCRQSYGQIQDILKQSYDFHISQGEIWSILEKEGRRLRPEYERLKARIRGEPSIHLDETGWKLLAIHDSGYAWTMVGGTSDEAVFALGKNRGKGNADALVGDSKAVLVHDGYAAYDHFENEHQRCFAHPLRKLRDLTASQELGPADRVHCREAYETFAFIYADVEAARTSSGQSPQYDAFLERLKTFSHFDIHDPAKLVRIKKEVGNRPEQFLTCLRHPGIAADNNAAERSLRHLVIKRKTSFGSLTERTADIMSVLYSMLLSYKRRGTLRGYLLGL